MVLYKLAVVLKEDYDDKKAEQAMIKQSKLHNGIFFSSCLWNMVFVGFFYFFQAAAKLSEAMYSSGWHNCYGQSSVRIRKLVVNAVRQAQEPVVYKTLGVVEFSYESYVTLVKMPYTAVSVFY